MMEEPDELLATGKLLPVMEEFYSIQGEGFNSGLAAYFLRIGGCDVGCHWCDSKESWNASAFPPVKTDSVVERILNNPSRALVVTGGEPMLYNLDYLCSKVKSFGVKTFLETSGSRPVSGMWDWICLSPKKDNPPEKSVYALANELKVIIHDFSDFRWAEEQAACCFPGCWLFLQPEWSQMQQMLPEIIKYVLQNPSWRISLQSHKFMRIP
jgi:organic radical activating enzyme